MYTHEALRTTYPENSGQNWLHDRYNSTVWNVTMRQRTVESAEGFTWGDVCMALMHRRSQALKGQNKRIEDVARVVMAS